MLGCVEFQARRSKALFQTLFIFCVWRSGRTLCAETIGTPLVLVIVFCVRPRLHGEKLSRERALLAESTQATTSSKSAWDSVPYFGINGLSMVLCLWSPLHPSSKLLAIQDHAQNVEEQLWMGGRREFISHRPVTSSDLKHERLLFRGSVSTFL